MIDADEIVEKMFSWMNLQKDSVVKLNELATELEEKQKAINVSKVVGSSVSVGGAAAMATAGVVSVLTGGLAIPFLAGAGAGALASGVGLVTNIGSDVASVIISSSTMEEAKKISTKMDDLNTELKDLMDSLLTKANRSKRAKNVSPEDYVMEAILKAMAKRNGLILNKNQSLIKLLSELPLEKIFKNTDLSFLKKSTLEMPLLSDFVTGLVSEELTKVGEKKVHKEVLKQGVTKAASSLGVTVSSKAVRKIGRGAVGLLFSVPELMENCANLEKSETEASWGLREKAGAIREAYEAMKSELNEIETLCERLAETKWKKHRKRRCLC